MKRVLTYPFILVIICYQKFISPIFPPTCKFYPTCSTYSLKAFRRYGPIKGLILTVKRIWKCHPWGGSGYDPVP